MLAAFVSRGSGPEAEQRRRLGDENEGDWRGLPNAAGDAGGATALCSNGKDGGGSGSSVGTAGAARDGLANGEVMVRKLLKPEVGVAGECRGIEDLEMEAETSAGSDSSCARDMR